MPLKETFFTVYIEDVPCKSFTEWYSNYSDLTFTQIYVCQAKYSAELFDLV